jgi:processive 1,2-diacylglycerol beta-glucosyltransferase
MPNKILILSASAGNGHMKAAESLDATVKASFPGVYSEHRDALDYAGRLFKKFYAKSYLASVNQTPALWGYFYRELDESNPNGIVAKAVATFDKWNSRDMFDAVAEFAPDHVICTHFLPSNVLLSRNGKDACKIPVSIVMTDFDAHFFWIHKGVHKYFVASDEVAWQLCRRGVPKETITVTGIPIMPVFSEKKSRKVLAEQMGISPSARTVLMMSGGFGIGDVSAAVKAVLAIEGTFQLIVVAGRNEELKAKIDALKVPKGKLMKVYGFVGNVDELMTVADIVVTKSGGLTVSESLAKSLPLVVFAPIPGQEERNCDYLLEHGAAVKAKDLTTLEFKLMELLRDGDRLAEMRSAAAKIARPGAALDVLRSVIAE